MKRALICILALVGLISIAQVANQIVDLTITWHGTTLKWSIELLPKTVLAQFVCDATGLEPSESTTCTVTINQAARPAAGITLPLGIPPGVTGPATVTIPQGATSATYTVSRPDASSLLAPPTPQTLSDGIMVLSSGREPTCSQSVGGVSRQVPCEVHLRGQVYSR